MAEASTDTDYLRSSSALHRRRVSTHLSFFLALESSTHAHLRTGTLASIAILQIRSTTDISAFATFSSTWNGVPFLLNGSLSAIGFDQHSPASCKTNSNAVICSDGSSFR